MSNTFFQGGENFFQARLSPPSYGPDHGNDFLFFISLHCPQLFFCPTDVPASLLVGILSEQVQSCICCNEFSQFICSFLLSLCGVLTLVSCPIAIVNVQVYFSLFKTVLQECVTFLIFHR